MPMLLLNGKDYNMPETGGVRPSLNKGHVIIEPKRAKEPLEVEASLGKVIQLITLAPLLPGRSI
jgi:hypothetical protein